jgi:hypothetical protein
MDATPFGLSIVQLAMAGCSIGPLICAAFHAQ